MAESRWQNAVTPAIPADLTASAEFLNSIIEFLINVANVAAATLDVVKSLLIGFLDPIRAIIEAIIAEIEAFLADLRQLGIYVTWDEAVFPFLDLVGGFDKYQARMLGRLINRADPTRPNFTSRSAVAGVFLYANANPTGIYTIIELITLILRLFGFNKPARSFPTPVGLSVSYGGSDIAAFGNLAKILTGGRTPDVAKVKWTIAAPASVIGPLPLIPAPPKFLVEVSVFEEGFGIAYNLPTPNANENRQTFGVVMDPEGQPLRVFGGSTLGLDDSLKSPWSNTRVPVSGVGTDGELKSNNVTVYAYRNSADAFPTPLSLLTGPNPAGKYLFQRTFVYDLTTLLGINLASPGQPFVFRLNAEDMPYNATLSIGSTGFVNVVPDDSPAREVYVRVRAVGAGYTADADGTLDTPLYYLDESTFNGKGTVIPATPQLTTGKGGFGPVSDPVKVTFPESGTAEYLDTVTTAIILLVLSRSDLRPILSDDADISAVLSSPSEKATTNYISYKGTVAAVTDVGLCPTGLEALANSVVPMFGVAASLGGKSDLKSLFGKEGDDQLSFRRKVLSRCRQLAEDFLARSGPPSSSALELIETLSEVSGTVLDEDGETTTVATTPLRLLTWGQVFPEIDDTVLGGKTILQAFNDKVTTYTDTVLDQVFVSGIAPNPLSIENAKVSDLRKLFHGRWVGGTFDPTLFQGVPIRRYPGFLLSSGGDIGSLPTGIGQGSADMSPVVYAGTAPLYKYAVNTRTALNQAPRVVFVRNGIVRLPALSLAIANVLGYASGSYLSGKPTGAWVAIRLFPQGIPPVDELLQKISDFLQAVLDGLQGIIDIIIAYIEFIQARIYELEALLRRIQALINLILSLDLSASLSALVVLNPDGGTDGLVRSFLGAGDKPPSSSDDLGIGMAMVAGGIPSAILELFTLIFPSED